MSFQTTPSKATVPWGFVGCMETLQTEKDGTVASGRTDRGRLVGIYWSLPLSAQGRSCTVSTSVLVTKERRLLLKACTFNWFLPLKLMQKKLFVDLLDKKLIVRSGLFFVGGIRCCIFAFWTTPTSRHKSYFSCARKTVSGHSQAMVQALRCMTKFPSLTLLRGVWWINLFSHGLAVCDVVPISIRTQRYSK